MDPPTTTNSKILPELMQVLAARRQANAEESYVARLYRAGPEQIRAKLAEESAELIAAVAETGGDRSDAVIHEGADLMFHTLVLLSWAGLSLAEVEGELSRRFGAGGLSERASRAGNAAGKPPAGGGS
jgi:phosphoribosyl-ATP pyrophosphohydrolase